MNVKSCSYNHLKKQLFRNLFHSLLAFWSNLKSVFTNKADVSVLLNPRYWGLTRLKLRTLETDSEMNRIFARSQVTTNRKPSAACYRERDLLIRGQVTEVENRVKGAIPGAGGVWGHREAGWKASWCSHWRRCSLQLQNNTQVVFWEKNKNYSVKVYFIKQAKPKWLTNFDKSG